LTAGISIVPLGTVTQEIAKQTLISVGIDDGDFFRPLAAIYKKKQGAVARDGNSSFRS